MHKKIKTDIPLDKLPDKKQKKLVLDFYQALVERRKIELTPELLLALSNLHQILDKSGSLDFIRKAMRNHDDNT